jgi:hypothetical protein
MAAMHGAGAMQQLGEWQCEQGLDLLAGPIMAHGGTQADGGMAYS